jgi:hypothetical protein
MPGRYRLRVCGPTIGRERELQRAGAPRLLRRARGLGSSTRCGGEHCRPLGDRFNPEAGTSVPQEVKGMTLFVASCMGSFKDALVE